MEHPLHRTVLSPIALTARDQVLTVIKAGTFDQVEGVCQELLAVNTRDMPPGAPGVKACVAAVMEGVLAALGSARTLALESAMHAVARYAAQREGADAMSVAKIIKDAASVLEVTPSDPDLEVAIQAALSACDQLLGQERSNVVAFLRETLSDSAPPGGTGLSPPASSA